MRVFGPLSDGMSSKLAPCSCRSDGAGVVANSTIPTGVPGFVVFWLHMALESAVWHLVEDETVTRPNTLQQGQTTHGSSSMSY